MYLNANNLYGWGMSQFLHTRGFRFLQQDENDVLKLQEIPHEDGFEVDLHYPTQLHDRHLLASDALVIDRSMYSSTQPAVFPESSLQRKLTPNLRDNVKYVVHYPNIKLYLQLGLAVTKVHIVMTFKQSAWLKTYIDANTRQRSLAGFLKDSFN